MSSIGFIMGFVGVAVALIIGILIYEAKGMAWMVISILPIALFFALFAIFSNDCRNTNKDGDED
jgi:hypothetical protein